MRLSLAPFALILAFGGCASQQAARQIQTDCSLPNGGISSDCASKHPSFSKLHPGYQKMVAYRVLLNEQIANKQITKAQADVMQLEYEDKIIAQADAAAAQQQASAAAANQALGNAGMTLMAAGQRMTPQQRAAVLSGIPVMPPTYVAPAPMMRTTNCNALGNSINCVSH